MYKHIQDIHIRRQRERERERKKSDDPQEADTRNGDNLDDFLNGANFVLVVM